MFRSGIESSDIGFVVFFDFVGGTDFVLDFFGWGYFLGFSLVYFLMAAVYVRVVGKVQFSHVVCVFDLVFHWLYFSLAHALLTTRLGKFATARLVTGIMTVLAFVLDALLIGAVGVIGVAEHMSTNVSMINNK